jgi:hypothetical protein
MRREAEELSGSVGLTNKETISLRDKEWSSELQKAIGNKESNL